MHEYALYGPVQKNDHFRMLQQIAGVTRMQPQSVKELHLVFKAIPPLGLNNIPSAGGSQGVQQQDVQRTKNMLNAGLYYVQLVGTFDETPRQKEKVKKEDVEMTNGANETSSSTSIHWAMEFKDTPDPGKHAVSTRLISKTSIQDGNLVQFLKDFGYEYVSRYVVTGSKVYDQDTTLFLHKASQAPQIQENQDPTEAPFLADVNKLQPLDGSGGYLLQVSIDIVDGNNPELKDRATRQLLAMKETLSKAVSLTPGDRLALDTRVPVNSRRN